jgi:hypothetical protein
MRTVAGADRGVTGGRGAPEWPSNKTAARWSESVRQAPPGASSSYHLPVLLLETQKNDIWEIVDESPYERHDLLIDQEAGYPILRFRKAPYEKYFSMEGSSIYYELGWSPGERLLEESAGEVIWRDVLTYVGDWLLYIKREERAAERRGASMPAPQWSIDELPSDYPNIVAEIERLQEEERRLRRMAGLLYETGDPLERLVRDVFRELGFRADHTAAGATYDVDVALPSGRLLIEVTGIDGQINKGSKKITQVLSVIQTVAAGNDRICVAANVYRDRSLSDRRGLEITTKDALDLLTRLNAVVFTTADLFAVWKLSIVDQPAAAAKLQGLQTAPPGVVALV